MLCIRCMIAAFVMTYLLGLALDTRLSAKRRIRHPSDYPKSARIPNSNPPADRGDVMVKFSDR